MNLRDLRFLPDRLLRLPFLPIMLLQATMIRKRIPSLPPAEGPEGNSQGTHGHLRLIAIGESTVACLGASTHEEGLTGSLAKALSQRTGKTVSWKVIAKAGYTARKVREKLVPRLEGEEADLVVIGLGGNDTFTLNSPHTFRRDIRALILAIRNRYPATPLVFMNVPPVREFPAFTSLIRFILGRQVDMIHRELQHAVREEPGVYFSEEKITIRSWIEKYGESGPSSRFFSDGVHPSLITYQTWAEDLAEFIVIHKILDTD